MFDVIIIGAGPAGLTAAIYACRRGLKTLVLTKDIGGQITKTLEIENYPGFEKVSGVELAQKMFAQAKEFGAEIKFEGVQKIEKKETGFTVMAHSTEYETKTIIFAFGKSPRKMDVPGEDEFSGKGVSYCATCDVPFYKGKELAVVGGGNSALDAALLASDICAKVYLIHRRDQFSAEEVLIDRVKNAKNIEILYNTEIKEIRGKEKVSSISINGGRELPVDGVLVEIGYIVDRSLAEGLVEIDDKNQIITNNNQETNVDGIFAAGDLTNTPYKQIIISAGEGAKAALSCYNYIQAHSDGKKIINDWH